MKHHIPFRSLLVCICGLALMACGTVDPPEGAGTSILTQELSYTSLGSTMGSSLVSGDTCGAANEVTPACSSPNTASDLSYQWTAPNAGKYTITATGVRTIPVLVLSDGVTQAQLGCGGSGIITYSLSAGQKVFATVDGSGSSCGSFTLGIQYAACGACNSPPTSGCYASPGQCVFGVCKYSKACDASEVCQRNQCIARCLIDPSFPC